MKASSRSQRRPTGLSLLASFPGIQHDLSTTPAMVQLTLTAYLLGNSIGQPIWGPLSDRFGRRTPLLVSCSVTVLSSLAVVASPTIGFLIGARFVQALSAASGMVIARAMVADLAEGYAGVRALALMMTIQGTVPVIAPAVGGLLATYLDWREVLAVFAALMALQLVVIATVVRETHPPARRAERLAYGDLLRVVRRPPFLAYAATVGLSVASVMTYISSASFVYQDVLGFSPLAFGASFAVNATGMVAGGLTSSRLAARHVHPARTVAFALPATVVACALVVVAAASPWPLLLVVPVLANAFAANLVMGNCMGMAMEHARGMPGAGSAVIGFFMFSLGALASPIPGALGGATSAVPMGAVMLVVAVLATTVFALGRRWVASHPGTEAAWATA